MIKTNLTIDEALSKPTISVPDAGRLFYGLGRDAAYAAAKSGQIQTVPMGRKLCVPVAPLAAKLGLRTKFGEAA